MTTTTTGGPDGPGWASVGECTLPTPERPLRVAQFDDLFAATLRSIDLAGPTHARLVLAGDQAVADRARTLTGAETACCSFFTFGVSGPEEGLVTLDIDVPAAYAEVLAGLIARADAVRREAS